MQLQKDVPAHPNAVRVLPVTIVNIATAAEVLAVFVVGVIVILQTLKVKKLIGFHVFLWEFYVQ